MNRDTGMDASALRGILTGMDRRNARLRFLHLFILNLLVVILAYSIFRRPMFSADSYQTVNDPTLMITPPLWGGRVSVSLFHRLEQLIGFHPVLSQLPGKLMLIFALALCPAVLTQRAYALLPRRSSLRLFALDAAFMIAFVNPFMGEWFHFSEASLYMGLGFLIMLGAVLLATGKRGAVAIGCEFLCLLVAVNLYQVFFSIM